MDLTPLRGAGFGDHVMNLSSGSHQSGTWRTILKATDNSSWNRTITLNVTATDECGNIFTKKVQITVLIRGDVVRDGNVDMGDALHIARYTVGLAQEPDPFVADVVGPGGAPDVTDGVDMGDALFIAKCTVEHTGEEENWI